ncbi:MAG: biotin transporter BioY [Peptostreptococcaceae bacterium]
MKLNTKEIVMSGLFAAITAVLSQISIPLPFTTVPLTMQVFAIALCGVILGSKKGVIAISVYLLLGAIGMPVFANMSGGLGVLVGPTGGFLLGCPLMAFIIGKGSEKSLSISNIILHMILGLIILYITGIIMFSAVTKMGIYKSIVACVLPFIGVDLIKIGLATTIGIAVKKRVSVVIN